MPAIWFCMSSQMPPICQEITQDQSPVQYFTSVIKITLILLMVPFWHSAPSYLPLLPLQQKQISIVPCRARSSESAKYFAGPWLFSISNQHSLRQRLRGRPCNQHCQTTSFKIRRHAISLDKRQNRAKSVHGQLEKRCPQLTHKVPHFFTKILPVATHKLLMPLLVTIPPARNVTKTHQPHAISPDAPQEGKWKLL